MSHDTTDPQSPEQPERRHALACLAAWTGGAIVWSLVGGVPRAFAADGRGASAPIAAGGFHFVQISDTHIGFDKAANPDVVGSLRRVIGGINALPVSPALVVHTGDVSHLSKPGQFGQARELLQELRVDRVHTVPGEHDALDAGLDGYLNVFDHDGKRRAWYSFDQGGVHFIGLSNVLNFTMGTMTSLGDEQLAWLKQDLAGVPHSTPIVVLAHIPLWTIYAPWGWGTSDADRALALLKPYGSVTVLNGHVHQVLQKVEGNIALHTAMSLAYPLPSPGQSGIGEPGPVTVPAGVLGTLLGSREVTVVRGRHALAIVDTPIERTPAPTAAIGGAR